MSEQSRLCRAEHCRGLFFTGSLAERSWCRGKEGLRAGLERLRVTKC